ncbi:hypothetical protein ACFJGV_17675 [Cnuibacter sp. UC19_7]|uniref:hypothetical protein n=1 Tax=Cnuibacter sp. UC19_7 TaxID=3350166 RepID=UPI00366AA561
MIGGLNPEFLAPEAPVAHQGTTDVDLLFALGFDDAAAGPDYSWLDEALAIGGFRSLNGWRWDATLGGARVRLEFLCDVWDHTADTVPLPGSHVVASKLAGPAAALVDPVLRSLPVTSSLRGEHPDAPDAVELRFANLGGYLLAKAAAAQSRMLAKDKYDLMYVTLYNEEGGAVAAAEAVRIQLELAGDAAAPDDIRSVMSRYVDPAGSWAGTFAQTMISTGDDAIETELRADASVGARQFLEALEP